MVVLANTGNHVKVYEVLSPETDTIDSTEPISQGFFHFNGAEQQDKIKKIPILTVSAI